MCSKMATLQSPSRSHNASVQHHYIILGLEHTQSAYIMAIDPVEHTALAAHDYNTIFKFADDTTVVGLITDEAVSDLAVWCNVNFSLICFKTLERIGSDK